MKILNQNSIVVILLAWLGYSCEERIYPTLQSADTWLVVDAWLNNKVEDQVITLTWSQPYLDNTLPPPVTGATVVLSYDHGSQVFAEDPSSPGNYRWVATAEGTAQLFGRIGRVYTLTISVDGETYTASSQIRRTVPVDSITFKYLPTDPSYPDNSYTADFWGTDSVGVGDTYWIRVYKNGVILNKPSELTVAFDASLSPGASFDGITFLPPVRAINANEVDQDDEPLSPYQVGDSVYVEIHSISLESYNFLNQVAVQTNRNGGFGELFSPPLSNVSTNISNINPTGRRALGFFNVSSVSGKGKKLIE